MLPASLVCGNFERFFILNLKLKKKCMLRKLLFESCITFRLLIFLFS